jgi:hypothetical protein
LIDVYGGKPRLSRNRALSSPTLLQEWHSTTMKIDRAEVFDPGGVKGNHDATVADMHGSLDGL